MISRLSSCCGLAFFSGTVRFILLSPGLFWHSLFRLNSSFKLVVALNDCNYPDWASLVSSVITGEDLFPYSGDVGVWFGATTGRVSTLVAVVSAACPGSLLSVSAFSAPCCLPPYVGSGLCPVAGLGVGVRLVVLWTHGRTEVLPVVSASYFLD